MSVVACKVTKNGYEVAADSITTRGYTQSKGQNVNHSKLFEVNEMVIGGVGLAQESSLLRLFAQQTRPKRADEDGILEFLSEFADWKDKKTKKGGIQNSYILGFDGKAFAISQWFVAEVLTYQAIGAGQDFALAALYLGKSVSEAVETAIELSIYCESPVQLISKETKKK